VRQAKLIAIEHELGLMHMELTNLLGSRAVDQRVETYLEAIKMASTAEQRHEITVELLSRWKSTLLYERLPTLAAFEQYANLPSISEEEFQKILQRINAVDNFSDMKFMLFTSPFGTRSRMTDKLRLRAIPTIISVALRFIDQ
jgi:hypothetical protein